MSHCRLLALIVSTGLLAGCSDAASPTARPIKPPPPAKLQQAEIWRTDFDAARAEARNDAKPLLVFFTAGWCGYCDQLKAELTKTPSFVEAAGRFVCVEIDGEAARDLALEYRVEAYPTIVLAAPQGAALQRLVGVQSPVVVVAQMNATITVVAGRQPAGAVNR